MVKTDQLNQRASPVNGTDDREAHPKFWIAVYTRPRSEKKAASELERMGISAYVPVQKQPRRWSDRIKYIEVVVIPMIIFVHVTEKDIISVINHPLVIKVLSYPGGKKAAQIPEYQIESLKMLLSRSKDAVEFISSGFSADDKVIVVKGSLKGLIGEVREVVDGMTVVWVGVNMLGGAVIRIKSSELEHYE